MEMLSSRHIIALQSVKGLGNISVKRLADHASKDDISSDEELCELVMTCIAEKIITRVKNVTAESVRQGLDAADRIMEKADRSGIGILSYGSDNYPQEMLCAVNCSGRPDIPLTLYCKGNLEALKHPGVAVIGTRHPSPAGRRHAEYCGERLAEAGCNIISGLAAGCDAAAHRGALSCPGGRTTALLGHGLDTVYPKEHASLARDILEHDGLLISEYPLGTRVTPFTLTARDRLQAALAQSVLVVQASAEGGTMLTARMALAAGKSLFCLHYAADNPADAEKTEGNRILTQEGGTALDPRLFADNILEILNA